MLSIYVLEASERIIYCHIVSSVIIVELAAGKIVVFLITTALGQVTASLEGALASGIEIGAINLL